MHPRSTPTRWEARVGGPGLTALLLPHIFPICSVVAPLRRGPHGADCAPWGGSSGRLAVLGATLDFHHGLLTAVDAERVQLFVSAAFHTGSGVTRAPIDRAVDDGRA